MSDPSRKSLVFQVSPKVFLQNQRVRLNSNSGKLDGKMRESMQELTVNKRVVQELQGFDELPGLAEPLNDMKADIDLRGDMSKNLREEQEKGNTIGMLSTREKVKYWFLLICLAFCRSSLYPFMAAIPQPIIHKLVWRSLLVVFNYYR